MISKKRKLDSVGISLIKSPVSAWSEAWVCGRSLAGIVGSNAAGGMDVCLLLVLSVVRYMSLRRADHSSRGVLPSSVCLSVILKPRNGRPWPGIGSKRHRRIFFVLLQNGKLETEGMVCFKEKMMRAEGGWI